MNGAKPSAFDAASHCLLKRRSGRSNDLAIVVKVLKVVLLNQYGSRELNKVQKQGKVEQDEASLTLFNESDGHGDAPCPPRGGDRLVRLCPTSGWLPTQYRASALGPRILEVCHTY